MSALGAIPFFRIRHINVDPSRPTVHQDEAYIKSFGWLSARYRRTRWWFLAYYVCYQFGRACFLGLGTMNPMAQVYGLLVFEVVAFIVVVNLDPFESSRNTALAVYILSIGKILTTGLSVAFLPAMKLDRIIATIIGFVVIAVQAIMVVAVMILIVLSTLSTWMSLSRNREEFEPDWMDTIRIKYFNTMEAKSPDTYTRPKPKRDRKGKGKATEAEQEEKEIDVPRPPSFFGQLGSADGQDRGRRQRCRQRARHGAQSVGHLRYRAHTRPHAFQEDR